MNIAVIVNQEKDTELKMTKRVVECFQRFGHRLFVSKEMLPLVNRGGSALILQGFDVIHVAVVIGGDGTVLHVSQLIEDNNVLILSINAGRLGFLTEIEIDEVEKAAECISAEEFVLDSRTMLAVNIIRNNICQYHRLFLNDIVVSGTEIARIIDLELILNQRKIMDMRADGLIVSTPTGSTGYSLSAGGPLITPNADCMVITPVCPHSLVRRPFVVPIDDNIEIKVNNHSRKHLLTVDGQHVTPVEIGDIIEVKKSQKKIHFIRMKELDFFSKIYKKLGSI